jgi:hypothetical protein
MPPAADPVPIGHRFHDWTVRACLGPRLQPNGKRRIYYECQCKCGRRRAIVIGAVRAAESRRCRSCATALRNHRHGAWGDKNGKRVHANYMMYQSMLHISARMSIPVDPRWRGPDGYRTFIADMGPPRRRGYDLRRIDTARGYGPDNCRVVRAEKRPPVILDGITYTIGELAFIHGIHPDTLAWRLRTMSPEDAVACPVGRTASRPVQPVRTSPGGSQTPSRESRP